MVSYPHIDSVCASASGQHHALTQARVFDLKGDMFKNLSIYEQRIAREMNKNLKTLWELQDRRKAEEKAAKPKTKTAGSASFIPTDVAAQTELTGQNGFGFANAQTPQPEPQNKPPLDEKIAA